MTASYSESEIVLRIEKVQVTRIQCLDYSVTFCNCRELLLGKVELLCNCGRDGVSMDIYVDGLCKEIWLGYVEEAVVLVVGVP